MTPATRDLLYAFLILGVFLCLTVTVTVRRFSPERPTLAAPSPVPTRGVEDDAIEPA